MTSSEIIQVARRADSRRPHAFKELLRGLDHIMITRPTPRIDWSLLANLLSGRAAFRNRISSLRICGRPGMCEDGIVSTKRVVGIFEDEGRGGKYD